MGIEVILATEDLGRNLVLLGRGTLVLVRMVRQVLEKTAKGLRAMQGTAGEKLLKLGLL
jgi:hypothetical protein